MNLAPSPRGAALRDRVAAFFANRILPRHREWLGAVAAGPGTPALARSLREEARAAGLWNLALPSALPNLDFAPLAENMGRLPWASEVFNCHAPDVPNMIMLEHAATADQRRRFLDPLLDGRVRSCFAMTEPAVASSDARNISASIRADGDSWVVDGRKWYITGAAHPDCAFAIVVGVSRPDAPRDGRHSCVIVPMNAPGVRVVRTQRFLGWDDHVAPIAELVFDSVRVPRENLLGEEGGGFRAAQVRLGPARLHHCMRTLGACEVLIELMLARASERRAFDRALVDYDSTQVAIARSRIEIEQARLLVLRAASALDTAGHAGAWREVAMIKVAVPEMAQRVADRALQLFGAMGGSDDTPIHHTYAMARLLRIADGPDEVHLRQVFRTEPPPSRSLEESPYLGAPASARE